MLDSKLSEGKGIIGWCFFRISDDFRSHIPKIKKPVESNTFENFMLVVTIANAIAIGIQATELHSVA